MRPTRILAVTASAVLGIAGGVVGGVLLANGSGFDDPLNLGIPLVDQACTGKALLLVGSGDSANALGPSAAESGSTRYLETSRSCPTAWRSDGRPAERYVTYLGPFDRNEACAQRMTAEHRGDRVTLLTSGSTDTVQCGCYVSYREMPELRTGATPTSRDIVYINALQEMLTKMGRRPDIGSTNVYDLQTASEVRRLQGDAGLPTTGATDPETWKSLQNRSCPLY